MIRVLETHAFLRPPGKVFGPCRLASWPHLPQTFVKCLFEFVFKNSTHFRFNGFDRNEDIFWAELAAKRFRWFEVAPAHEAMGFSFEVNPSVLYRMNGGNLPFGCHGWGKYDPDFWGRHIVCHGK